MEQFGRKLGFFTAFIIPGLVVIGFYFGGYWNFTALVFSFLIVPLIDQYLGVDTSNISDEEAAARSEAFYYRFVTYVWTYIQLGFICWAAWAVTSGRLTGSLQWVAFTMVAPLLPGGIGITVAHELSTALVQDHE